MLELFRSWILGLSGAAIFCAVVTELCPSGSTKKILGLLCGSVMAVALISPFLQLDFSAYSLNMAKYRAQAETVSLSAKENADSYSRTLIEEQCRAYILDKALSLGVDIADASVKLKWNEGGFWYPVECSVEANYDVELAGFIECELGIGEENQKWGTDENN